MTKIVALLLACVQPGAAENDWARTVSMDALTTIQAPHAPQAEIAEGPLYRAIEQARAALTKAPVGNVAQGRKKMRQVAIAYLNRRGEIRISYAFKSGNNLTVFGTPRVPVSDVERQMRIVDTDIDKGINSAIWVPDGIVLAWKYPLSKPTKSGANYAIYSPYSPMLKNPELVERGAHLLGGYVKQAYDRLRAAGVRSKAFPGDNGAPGLLVADVIPQLLPIGLIINEQINPRELKTQDQVPDLVAQVLTIIGSNGDKSFRFRVSKAGARGLVQMIPSTYKSRVLAEYDKPGMLQRANFPRNPKLSAFDNFVKAMNDPVTAIMAEILLCDSEWALLNKEAREKGLPVPNADYVSHYIAIAYNGGPKRAYEMLDFDEYVANPDTEEPPTKTKVVREYDKKKRKWVLVTKTFFFLRDETATYVEHYHWIDRYLSSVQIDGLRPGS